jgi:hypothetical protein
MRFLLLSFTICLLLTAKPLLAGIITGVSVTGSIENRVTEIAGTPLGEDALAYTDRVHEWNSLPAGLPQLLGAQYIKTGNDDRDDPDLKITVSLGQAADLIVLAMGLKPSPSGESFRFFGYQVRLWRYGKLSHQLPQSL